MRDRSGETVVQRLTENDNGGHSTDFLHFAEYGIVEWVRFRYADRMSWVQASTVCLVLSSHKEHGGDKISFFPEQG